MPCSSSVNRNFGCTTDKNNVAVSATAVASKAAIATGVTCMLPVSDVWREILALAYATDGSGSGRGCGVWNQTATQLDKACTWGDGILISSKTVVYKVV